MQAYVCTVCGYLYNDENALKNNLAAPISFQELSENWKCPVCAVGKEHFIQINQTQPLQIFEPKTQNS